MTTEHCSTTKTANADFLSYHLYFWEGLIIACANLFLFYVIISKRALSFSLDLPREYSSKLRAQKEYLLYSGCIVFDIIFGCTYVIAAIYRFLLAWSNTHFPLFTKYQCLITPHIILFVFITPGAGLLVFACALDRFHGVFFPVRYMRRSSTYVLIIFVITFGIAFVMLVCSLLTSADYNTIYNQQATCTTSQAVTTDMYLTLRLTRVVGSCAAALVYVPVSFRIFKNVSAMTKAQFSSNRTKKLLRTTITVLLITCSTFLMFTLPDVILLINPKTTSNLFYIFNLNKGIINLFIFFITQNVLRDATVAFIKCKKLNIATHKVSNSRVVVTSVKALPKTY